MIKSKKQMFIVIGVFCLILLLGTTTYAFFNYTRTGSANTIKVGRIYFNSDQTKSINLTNAFPIRVTRDNNGKITNTDGVDTFEIDIVGDTDYDDGVEYLVSSVNTNASIQRGNETINIPINLEVDVTNLGQEEAEYFDEREAKNATIYKNVSGAAITGDQPILVGYIKPNTTKGTVEGVNGKITIKAYLDASKIAISDTYPEGAIRTVKTTGYTSVACETALTGVSGASTYCASASDLQDAIDNGDLTSSQIAALVTAGLVSEYVDGTTDEWVDGRIVLTTTEWNSLQANGVSFKVKVEANEGIWVDSLDPVLLYSAIRKKTVMDNINSDYVDNNTPGIDFTKAASDDNGKGVYTRAGTENDTYPIMYYRGNVSDNNVIFANKCWQIVRTTDTGGIKLLYNGVSKPERVVDLLAKDDDYDVVSNTSYYGDGGDYSFMYDSDTKEWKNKDDSIYMEHSTLTISPKTSGNIVVDYDVKYGYIRIKRGNNYVLSYNTTSKSTFAIENVVAGEEISFETYEGDYTQASVKFYNYYETAKSVCNNSGNDTIVTINNTNKFKYNAVPMNYSTGDYNDSPAYVGYMVGDKYIDIRKVSSDTFLFGSGYEYINNRYYLTGTANGASNTRHYTCFDSSDNCQTVSFVNYASGNTYHYINLSNNEDMDDALAKMHTNKTTSDIKTKIDQWYASNLLDYENKLEDTIWCNDRSMYTKNGFDPSGTMNYGIVYGADGRLENNLAPSLACTNANDKFTVDNDNGNKKLDYPIALLTGDEVRLAGAAKNSKSNLYLKTTVTYWLMSPAGFVNGVNQMMYVEDTDHDDLNDFSGSGSSYGIRPSISLKNNTVVASGTGLPNDPYVIE